MFAKKYTLVASDIVAIGKEYDPLWVSCGHAVRGSTGLSVIAVLLFSIVVFPTLLVGEGFGNIVVLHAP